MTSVCREPLRARFASARALSLSNFVLYITENKIAQWKSSRRRDPDILHLMAGDHDTLVTAVDDGAGYGVVGWGVFNVSPPLYNVNWGVI